MWVPQVAAPHQASESMLTPLMSSKEETHVEGLEGLKLSACPKTNAAMAAAAAEASRKELVAPERDFSWNMCRLLVSFKMMQGLASLI